MNFVKRMFLRLDSTYLIKNYIIGLIFGFIFWNSNLGGTPLGTKIYVTIAVILFPFSKLIFNDLRAVLLKGRVIMLPVVISLIVSLSINAILFCGTWIFSPLGFIYLYFFDKREQKKYENEQIEEFTKIFKEANLKEESGKLEDALELYSKLLSIDETFFQGYNFRARVKIELEDYEGALEDCEKSLKYEKNNPAAFLNRGATYMYLEKLDLADKDLAEALKLANNYQPKDDEEKEDIKNLKKIILEYIDSLKNLKNDEKKVDK